MTKPKPDFTPLPRALRALALLIVAIELALTLRIGGAGLRSAALEYGAFWPPLLHGAPPAYPGQGAVMFLSHAFLHGSLLHMAMNTAILLALGRFCADRYGDTVIVPLFVVSAVAGAALYGAMADTALPMVGASGAVFGFIGVWIYWDWRRHRDAGVFPRPVLMRALVLIGLNVVMYVGLGGMVAWEAHLGGALAGLIFAHFLRLRGYGARPAPRR